MFPRRTMKAANLPPQVSVPSSVLPAFDAGRSQVKLNVRPSRPHRTLVSRPIRQSAGRSCSVPQLHASSDLYPILVQLLIAVLACPSLRLRPQHSGYLGSRRCLVRPRSCLAAMYSPSQAIRMSDHRQECLLGAVWDHQRWNCAARWASQRCRRGCCWRFALEKDEGCFRVCKSCNVSRKMSAKKVNCMTYVGCSRPKPPPSVLVSDLPALDRA